jgi:hypothetical protein
VTKKGFIANVRIEIKSSLVPRLTKWHIQRILRWVPAQDLRGLGMIRVMDECPDKELDSARVPTYMWGFLYNGRYIRRNKNRPPEIVLFANDVYFGIPKALLASPVATLKIADTLAHELGHHLVATRGYVYRSSEKYRPYNGVRNPHEEDIADRYAADITKRMLKRPRYRIGKLMSRVLSNLLYRAGLQNYWKENYQAAASMLARAHSLNLENEDAGQAYRHAMEKLKTQTPSRLSEAEKHWLFKKYSSKALTATRKPYFSSER